MNPTYTYKDISLVPRKLSKIHSRDDVDLSQEIKNLAGRVKFKISLPVIPSPMETIATQEMCKKLDNFGMWSTIHRFQSFENRLAIATDSGFKTPPLVSVGVGDEELDNISRLIEGSVKNFNIDIANGFNTIIESTISHIMSRCPDAFIMCGNVASAEGFKYLANLGVDCVRVGIGNGSVCSTSINTGVGQGIASALGECVEVRKNIGLESTMVLADGGLSNPGDVVKAVAIGADLVMTGTLFAGTKESGGDVVVYNNEKHKIYRGSASYAAQHKSSGKAPKYIEGGETLVKYKPGGAEGVVQKIEAGMRSALSYMGAKNLTELRENADFVCYHLDQKLF